ncbi:glycogen debranching protein [bacterium]|nr:glycogen debranching protein [bacterium]
MKFTPLASLKHILHQRPYSVGSRRVVQGPFSALAKSRYTIVSTYPAQGSTPKVGQLKEHKRELKKVGDKNILSSLGFRVSPVHPSGFIAPSSGSFIPETPPTSWTLTQDISAYPSFLSGNMLFDALYNLALEEMMLNKSDNEQLYAGANWQDVWTRDVSYSIILSLAMIEPEAAKKSLMARVENGQILQDTGTGGSWPISTDRIVWILAAWEIYAVTGDKEWLETIFPIAEKSVSADMVVAFNQEMNLFYGETSFLDWREQTYPSWMTPKDIFETFSLSTNVIMVKAYEILDEIEKIVEGEATSNYATIAKKVSTSINENFWLEDQKYFGQYLVEHGEVSTRAEHLGEAMAVIFDVAPLKKQQKVISNTPILPFGTPCIFPQTPGISSYHNDGIWPFVQAFWNTAAAKVENLSAVSAGLDAMIRASALFLSHKENFQANSGCPDATLLNSDRQLWSVAGFLSMAFKVLVGMEFEPSGIHFSPAVPKSFSKGFTLKDFAYRDSILTIQVDGYGTQIESIFLDGKPLKNHFIPGDLSGNHQIEIQVKQTEKKKRHATINLVENQFSLPEPNLSLSGRKLVWDEIPEANSFEIFKNGKSYAAIRGETYFLPETVTGTYYQIAAVDSKGQYSLLSRPVSDIFTFPPTLTYPAVSPNELETFHKGYKGIGYVRITPSQYTELEFHIEVPETGNYLFDIRYANGNGSISTGDKCAVRSLYIGNSYLGPVVFPQLGDREWSKWYYSNSTKTHLEKGRHVIRLRYMAVNQNMNKDINEALIDHIRLLGTE